MEYKSLSRGLGKALSRDIGKAVFRQPAGQSEPKGEEKTEETKKTPSGTENIGRKPTVL